MKKHISTREFLMIILLIGFFILLIIDPQGVLSSGQQTVDLCLKVIIPSLLPFFIISRLILNTGAIHSISRLFRPVIKPLFKLPGAAAFPVIAGWFSGYPAGAKYTADLYKQGLLTDSQAERLISFCNNSGPLFIVGAVGTGYFNSPELGLILLICHILASFTVGILQRFIFKDNSETSIKEKEVHNRKIVFSSHMLTDAIIDSMAVLLQICGTIIFFAVLVQTLEAAGIFSGISKLVNFITKSDTTDFIRILTAGSFEITYGLFILSRSSIISMDFKILLTSFLCGFGGFSVFTQVTGLCPPKIKMKKYIYGKLLHGFIASIYTAIFIFNRAVPTMNYTNKLYSAEFSKGIMLVYVFLLAFLILYLIRIHYVKKNHRH